MKLSVILVSAFVGLVSGSAIAASTASVPTLASEARTAPALTRSEVVQLPNVIQLPEQYVYASAPAKRTVRQRELVCTKEFATLGGTVRTCWVR